MTCKNELKKKKIETFFEKSKKKTGEAKKSQRKSLDFTADFANFILKTIASVPRFGNNEESRKKSEKF